jgi:hypothetical protein
MDPFEKKRGMVQELLQMLKRHASDEVGSGLKRPEGSGDMHGIQDEKIEDLPDHEMDQSTPEHEIDTKLIPEGKSTANMGYNKGGIVENDNAETYGKEPIGKIPYESEQGHPDLKGAVENEASEPLDKREAEIPEESMHPAFETFLKRKKK